MNKYSLFLIPVLAIVSLVGCRSDKKGWSGQSGVIDTTYCTEITVDPRNGDFFQFDSLMDRVSFIRLETNDSCLIGEISQMVCVDSLIFIADREIAKAVYCFNRQGSFLRKIGSVGQGPGEYNGYLCYITLSADKKHLIVMDYGKIIHYDFDGNLLKEEAILNGFPQINIEFLTDDIVAGYNDSGDFRVEGRPILSVADKKQDWERMYSAFPTFRRDNFILAPVYSLQRFDDKVYFSKPYSEQFFEVTKDGLREIYRLHIIDGGFPPITEDLDDNIYFEQMIKVVTCGDFVVLKDAVLFCFGVDGMHSNPFMVYYPESKQSYKCDMNYTNPLFYFYNTPRTRYGANEVVKDRSANYVLSVKDDLYNNPTIEKEVLDQLYNGLTEDSNPVLFFYRIKQQ